MNPQAVDGFNSPHTDISKSTRPPASASAIMRKSRNIPGDLRVCRYSSLFRSGEGSMSALAWRRHFSYPQAKIECRRQINL
jgi:hypothetical protein